MKQTTINHSVELVGIGLHKGVPVKLVLEPLGENQGIVFYRSDLGVNLPLKPENIVDTKMATVLGKDNARISTIEHLLSAVHMRMALTILRSLWITKKSLSWMGVL